LKLIYTVYLSTCNVRFGKAMQHLYSFTVKLIKLMKLTEFTWYEREFTRKKPGLALVHPFWRGFADSHYRGMASF